MDEKEKFLYEQAIKGREHHQNNFNHWMNMYAIFNGALFVGYYNIDDKESLFSAIILLLGCAAGWAWAFSAIGFYDWIISWINVVKKHEAKIEGVVYRAYYSKQTISTQKLTKLFTKLVALAWTVLTSYSIGTITAKAISIPEYTCCLMLITFILILVLALILYISCLESKFITKKIE